MFTRSFRTLRLTLCAAALGLTFSAHADTTLFEVSDGKSTVLIGGTIHLLHPSDFPLPEAFDQAYETADALYLETDLEAMQDPAFGQRMAQTMLYPAGKTLSSELSPDTWKEVAAYSEQNQFPIQQFVGFHPAFVSIIMTVMKAQSLGITDGVDAHYYQKAKDDGKAIGELESKEDVLGYMEAMKGLDGDAVMEATLRDIKRFEELMSTMVEAWKQGDLDALDRDLGQPMREEAPELYQTLLVDRNAQWLEEVEDLFEQEGTELVLVGSLHLAGKQNLLEMLKEAGYDVARYEP